MTFTKGRVKENNRRNEKQNHVSPQFVHAVYKISDPTATDEYQAMLRKNRKPSK